MHGKNIEDYDKHETVASIEFEATVPSIKEYLFFQRMVDFLNKLELSYQKYHTIGNVIDENYKGEFLFPMKEVVSLVTDRQ